MHQRAWKKNIYEFQQYSKYNVRAKKSATLITAIIISIGCLKLL